MNAFFATVVIFFVPIYFVAFRRIRGGLFSANASKIIIIFHMAPIIFGIVAVAFFNFDLWMGLEKHLTDSMRFTVGFQSIFAIYLMLLFIHLMRHRFSRLDQTIIVQKNKSARYRFKKLPFFLVIITLLFYLFELVRLPVIPLIAAITEGPVAGAVARGYVIEFQINNGLPGLGYVLYFAPIISLVWLYTQYIAGNVKYLFWIFAALYFGFNILFLAKSAFIAPGLMIMWVRYTDKNILFDFKVILSIIALIIFMFAFIAFESPTDLIGQVLKRAFISQTQGMFLIREFYSTSDINALLYGLPFKGSLGLETFDPSVEIIRKLYGKDIDGFVNMNSFFIGQGFVMLGNAIIILGPIAYAFNIWMIFALGPIFKRCTNSGLMRIIQFFFILTLAINTNFALLLFIRAIVGFIIVSLFFEIVCFLSKSYSHPRLAHQIKAY